jgi:O-antigen/teichoic acid export membrane protein
MALQRDDERYPRRIWRMVNMETGRKFTFDVGWVFLTSIVAMVIGLLIRIILGNYFNAAGLGAYAMVLTIWSIVTLTTGAGAPGALIKYVAECPDDKDTRDSLVSTSILNGFLMGLAATVLFIIIAPWLESIFNIPDLARLLRIASLSFPFVTANNSFVSYLNGIRKMKSYAAFQIYRKGIVIVFTVLFIWMGLGIPGAVWALVMAPLSVTVAQIILQKRYFNPTFLRYKECTKKLYTFGGKLFAANIVITFNSQLAPLLIGFYLLDSDVGIYTVAIMFVAFLNMLPGSIQTITYPAISEYYSKQNYVSMKKMMETTMRFSFVFFSVISLILIFYADDLISLIFPGKSEFLGAVSVFRILAICSVLYGSLISIGAIFTSMGRPDIPLKISCITILINFAFLALLIPMDTHLFGFQVGGINGAAIAYSITMFFNVFIHIILIKKMVPIDIDFKKQYIGSAFFLLIIALAFLASPYIEGNLVGLIVIPIFSIGLYYFGIITRGGFNTILSMLRKKQVK